MRLISQFLLLAVLLITAALAACGSDEPQQTPADTSSSAQDEGASRSQSPTPEVALPTPSTIPTPTPAETPGMETLWHTDRLQSQKPS